MFTLRVSGGCTEPDLADGAVIRVEGSRLFVPGSLEHPKTLLIGTMVVKPAMT